MSLRDNPQLKLVVQHHFWILVSGLILASLVTWYMATGDLQAAYTKDSLSIKSSFSQANGVSGQPLRNNELINKVKDETTKIREQAKETWKQRDEAQQPLLKWPDDMADKIKLLKPGESIPNDLRDYYQVTVLPREWRRMILKASPLLDDDKTPVSNEDFQYLEVDPKARQFKDGTPYAGKVVWPKDKWRALINRYQSPNRPSDLRVRLAQEDLWIYDSLIDIINTMNEAARDPGQAVIKEIQALEIAQWAVRDSQDFPGPEIKEIIKTGGTSGTSDTSVRAVSINPPTLKNGNWVDSELLSGRYLDALNNPVDDKAPAPFSEFRQMYVVMRFLMDQRRIPDLVTLCANARFPIAVRQVLMNFYDKDAGDIGAATQLMLKHGQHATMVEIRGIIYIYNGFDETKLGQGATVSPARRTWAPPRSTPNIDPSASKEPMLVNPQ